MKDIPSFKSLISSPKSIAIIVHQFPDGDALGSALGLAAFLKKQNHSVTVVSPTDYHKYLKWIKGTDALIIADKSHLEKSFSIIENTDVICCVDFSNLERIGELGEAVKKSKAIKVVIDHHPNPQDFAEMCFWNTKAAATAEIIFEMIEKLGQVNLIDNDIADCLYTAILTDTNSFRTPNTTIKSHLIASQLMQLGADTVRINRLIYENNSINKLQFSAFAVSNRLTVMPEYKTAYFVIKAEDLKKFGLKSGDTDGLVNQALSLENILVAVLISEKENKVKLSLRSVGSIPVNEWVQKYFGGGGHKNAAGATSDLSLEDTVKKVEIMIKENKHLIEKEQC